MSSSLLESIGLGGLDIAYLLIGLLVFIIILLILIIIQFNKLNKIQKKLSKFMKGRMPGVWKKILQDYMRITTS